MQLYVKGMGLKVNNNHTKAVPKIVQFNQYEKNNLANGCLDVYRDEYGLSE